VFFNLFLLYSYTFFFLIKRPKFKMKIIKIKQIKIRHTIIIFYTIQKF